MRLEEQVSINMHMEKGLQVSEQGAGMPEDGSMGACKIWVGPTAVFRDLTVDSSVDPDHAAAAAALHLLRPSQALLKGASESKAARDLLGGELQALAAKQVGDVPLSLYAADR